MGKKPLFPHVPKSRGTCYEDAWRYVIREEEGELVHGTVLSEGRRIGHAWVELLSDYIWEPETGKYFTPDGFQVAASPVVEHKYSVEEAAIMAAKSGHHGPWTDVERQQSLEKSSGISEEKLREFIDKVPDENDPDIICYWRKIGDQVVYLEGWADECLVNTGFPTMERGNHQEKINYIEDLTNVTLAKKTKPEENPWEVELKLIRGSFVELPEAENLYGVSYGIYEMAEKEKEWPEPLW